MLPRRIIAAVSTLIVLSGAQITLAGEPPTPAVPDKASKKPFPEIPQILWFEDFDGGRNIVNYGKIDEPKIDAPKNNLATVPAEVRAMPPEGKVAVAELANVTNSTAKWSVAGIQIGATGLKLPSDYKINDLALHFLIWGEELGDVALQMTCGTFIHEAVRPMPVAKAWTPITIRFTELGGTGGKVKPDEIFTDMKLMLRPRMAKAAFVKCYIDNIFITNGTNKLGDILPLIEMARKRAKEIEKRAAADGFMYSDQHADVLRAALKAGGRKRRSKSVLVIAPRRGEGPDFLKALTSAAMKNKLNGFTFVPAAAPDDSPVGGLDDSRMLLRYNIDKSDSEFVLVACSYADARAADRRRAGEGIRVLIDRIIEAGCIPLVSVPPPIADPSLADKARIEEFATSVANVCAIKGVTMIECSSALKGVTTPLNENELSAAALSNLAGVCVQAIKHLDLYLLGRKQ